MKDIIAQFIPIILVFMIVSNINQFVLFGNTILGKLLAVFIIIFYASIDTILGVFVCMLTILFYQLDYVENMLNMYDWDDSKQPNKKKIYNDISDAVKQFRKENCVNDSLKYKNISVNDEMSTHIFPELKYNDRKCNSCSKSCDISIIESKLKTESSLIPTIRTI